MTKKEIKLSFWEPTTGDEFEVVVKESQLQELRLYDITHSVRYKNNHFLGDDVVGEFIIKLSDMNSEIVDKLKKNYRIDEISIYEDNMCIHSVSVRLDLYEQQCKITDNIVEISQFQ